MSCGIKRSNANANNIINTGNSHGAITKTLRLRIETLWEYEECSVSLGLHECPSAHFWRWLKCLSNCFAKSGLACVSKSEMKCFRCEYGGGFFRNASEALGSQYSLYTYVRGGDGSWWTQRWTGGGSGRWKCLWFVWCRRWSWRPMWRLPGHLTMCCCAFSDARWTNWLFAWACSFLDYGVLSVVLM